MRSAGTPWVLPSLFLLACVTCHPPFSLLLSCKSDREKEIEVRSKAYMSLILNRSDEKVGTVCVCIVVSTRAPMVRLHRSRYAPTNKDTLRSISSPSPIHLTAFSSISRVTSHAHPHLRSIVYSASIYHVYPHTHIIPTFIHTHISRYIHTYIQYVPTDQYLPIQSPSPVSRPMSIHAHIRISLSSPQHSRRAYPCPAYVLRDVDPPEEAEAKILSHLACRELLFSQGLPTTLGKVYFGYGVMG